MDNVNVMCDSVAQFSNAQHDRYCANKYYTIN